MQVVVVIFADGLFGGIHFRLYFEILVEVEKHGLFFILQPVGHGRFPVYAFRLGLQIEQLRQQEEPVDHIDDRLLFEFEPQLEPDRVPVRGDEIADGQLPALIGH